MHAELREHAAFYLTGKRSGAEPDPVEELGMRPALLAGYRDLTALRYDFPIVLLKDSPDGSMTVSVTRSGVPAETVPRGSRSPSAS